MSKAPTGITGFDEICGGGLPRGCTTLLVGGPGSGKTIFALQFAMHGAQYCKEPAIFVAFEETSKRVIVQVSAIFEICSGELVAAWLETSSSRLVHTKVVPIALDQSINRSATP
jgi:KaiC/GvpD/RAD55 family RecA-like ATPase